jgi:preprotein translocase subunit SecG
MNNKKTLVKRMLTLSSFLLIGVLLLTACNGALSFQGSVNPNEEGGIDVTGGTQPDAAQPAAAPGMDQTTLILVVVGAVVLILILIMLVSRRSSGNPPPQ